MGTIQELVERARRMTEGKSHVIEIDESYVEPANDMEEAVRLVLCQGMTVRDAAKWMELDEWKIRALLLDSGKVPKRKNIERY
jgi:hypothetical protein